MCMVSYFCGFQHSILGSKLLSQNDPGKFHTDVEQCSCYLNVSHFGILTKELQIQNWGTSVSLYHYWYVEDSESHYLPGESSNTVGDTLKLISVNSHMMLLTACCRNTHKKEAWSLTLNKKLNSNALAAPGGCQKCENCRTIKLCPILLIGFAEAPYQWTS